MSEPVGPPKTIVAFAALPPRALLDGGACAAAFSTTVRNWRKWVARGEMPPGVAVGRDVYWTPAAILDWLDARRARAARLGPNPA